MGASASLLKDIMSIVKLMRIDAIKKCGNAQTKTKSCLDGMTKTLVLQ